VVRWGFVALAISPLLAATGYSQIAGQQGLNYKIPANGCEFKLTSVGLDGEFIAEWGDGENGRCIYRDANPRGSVLKEYDSRTFRLNPNGISGVDQTQAFIQQRNGKVLLAKRYSDGFWCGPFDRTSEGPHYLFFYGQNRERNGSGVVSMHCDGRQVWSKTLKWKQTEKYGRRVVGMFKIEDGMLQILSLPEAQQLGFISDPSMVDIHLARDAAGVPADVFADLSKGKKLSLALMASLPPEFLKGRVVRSSGLLALLIASQGPQDFTVNSVDLASDGQLSIKTQVGPYPGSILVFPSSGSEDFATSTGKGTVFLSDSPRIELADEDNYFATLATIKTAGETKTIVMTIPMKTSGSGIFAGGAQSKMGAGLVGSLPAAVDSMIRTFLDKN
tara:strand:+ start:19657 stop:20823 length:1167 start_codon:yes stop_codon:yes gene_type:complete